MSESTPALPFTGERFTPECVREIWHEHVHRYAFALQFARDARVLDAACGEGYGTALLASVAREAVGVDIDAASIAHARARYADVARVRFECADAAALPFADESFDLVVSFETIEHLAEQERLVAGFARVLERDGLLVISSPDKATYGDAAGFRNEYHVRELYRDELLELLRPHFPHVRLYGQKLLFQSAMWTLDAPGKEYAAITASRDGALADSLDYAPMYYVALCSREPIRHMPSALSLFGDREESVYAHYNHEIRKNMSAGARIAELERELAALREHRPAAPPSFLEWFRRWRTNRRGP